MSIRKTIWTVSILACALSGAWAQDSSTPPADAAPQSDQQQGPVPAYGQDNQSASTSENPPLSGIDLPSLEPNAAPLSYLQPGATASETADSNAVNALGGGQSFSSVSRALGSIALRRLWSNYDLAIDYVGGAAYYSQAQQGWKLLQEMNLDQKIRWKRGALSLRDSFSYLPEGNFGSSYGSEGSLGVKSLGNTAFGAFFGGSALGNLGLAPRILNVSLADVTESLTPKSSLTAAAGYAFTHFYGNDVSTGTPFLGVTQISAQGGYNRILSPHTQLALTYGYQGFDYSVAGMAFHSHVVQAMVGHRITGRMDFLIAAGPQVTLIDSQSAVCSNPALPLEFCQIFGGTVIPISNKNTKLGVAGQMRLRYKFPRTSVDLTYQRFQTSGSGLFAGAQSDIARLTVSRPLSRVWTLFADIGYAHNERLQTLSALQLANCVYPGQLNPGGLPPCPGVNARTYQYGFLGGGVHRRFGHDFHGFMTYQFNELAFDNSFCAGLTACNRISNRQVITVGLDWTPRPIRLD
jgi:hypothetical protein